MVNQVRVHQFCDWCFKREDKETPAEGSISFTVGNKAKRYDHCGLAKHTNPPWTDLLELASNAEQDEAAPRRTGTHPLYTCPKCEQNRTGRTGLIGHLVSIHQMDQVEASNLVPPANQPTINCELCGYLAVAGTGYAAHVTSVHGEAAWKKIKAKMARATKATSG